MKTRSWLGVSSTLLLLFLYLPLVVVALCSFNNSRHSMTWSGFTTQWYAGLGRNETALNAVANSLLVAAGGTAMATFLGALLGWGLARRGVEHPAAAWIKLPICLPDIVQAVSLLLFFSFLRERFGIFQLGTTTMMLAHATFQIPFVAMVVRARAAALDPAWAEAARDLGATPLQVFRHVTLPLLRPGILAGALLAFTLSLDDFVVSFFTGGAGGMTLPVLIYSSVKRGVTPDIHALSTLLTVASVLAALLVTAFNKAALLPGASSHEP